MHLKSQKLTLTPGDPLAPCRPSGGYVCRHARAHVYTRYIYAASCRATLSPVLHAPPDLTSIPPLHAHGVRTYVFVTCKRAEQGRAAAVRSGAMHRTLPCAVPALRSDPCCDAVHESCAVQARENGPRHRDFRRSRPRGSHGMAGQDHDSRHRPPSRLQIEEPSLPRLWIWINRRSRDWRLPPSHDLVEPPALRVLRWAPDTRASWWGIKI
jgi:hypothetical protein